MKNKFFISFCINILVGILFSFPVFSAQGIHIEKVQYLSESSLTENESGFKNNSDQFKNSIKFYPQDKQLNVPDKSLRKVYTPGDRDDTHLSAVPPGFKRHFIDCFASDCNYLNPTFVNLSYLKDLRTTKMLC